MNFNPRTLTVYDKLNDIVDVERNPLFKNDYKYSPIIGLLLGCGHLKIIPNEELATLLNKKLLNVVLWHADAIVSVIESNSNCYLSEEHPSEFVNVVNLFMHAHVLSDEDVLMLLSGGYANADWCVEIAFRTSPDSLLPVKRDKHSVANLFDGYSFNEMARNYINI